MNAISLQDLQSLTRTGIGLVIGPGLTENPNHEGALAKQLSRLVSGPVHPEEHFLRIADKAYKSEKASPSVVHDIIKSHFENPLSVSTSIFRLLNANLKAVVSLSFDSHFKTKYNDHYESKPVGKMLATVASPDDRPPPGSMPYYSLLGDPSDLTEERRLVTSESEYVLRKADWPQILRSLPDAMLGDPLFLIGHQFTKDRVSDFLSTLRGLGHKTPRRLILLKDDPILEDMTITRILEKSFEALILKARINEVGDAFSKETLSVKSLPLWSTESGRFFSSDLLSRVDKWVSYVPKNEEIQANPERRNKLLDSLFRPTHLDWEPYSLELPFKRDAHDEICGLIGQAPDNSTIRFGGDAAVGKTVMLRQAAFDLAQNALICFWFRRFFDNPSANIYDELVREINSGVNDKDTKIYLFLDDPIGTRVNEGALLDSLQRAKFKWKLVVCQRSSETAMARGLTFDHVLPNKFSDSEIERFRKYRSELVSRDGELESEGCLIGRGTSLASDILCNLWYSLPQTKAALAEAISEEYDRLAGVESIIESFVTGDGHESMKVARTAYEMVTVCSSIGNIGLPVEVLVSALGIGYEEWAIHASEGRPVWGLIYDEEAPAIESWVYRSRNKVVTDILMRHLNRGGAQHSHQFRTLLKLVKGCGAGAAPYRQFLLDVLVSNRRQIEEHFDLERAVELYETALEVYPRKLGALEYHFLLCKRKLGGDTLEIYDELSQLISRAKASPEDYDSPDKLHTSAAATMRKAYADGKISADEASEAIYRHVTTALGIAPHSLHATHTQAKSLLTIGAEIRSENSAGSVQNIIRAANLVERSLMALDAGSLHTESEAKDFRLFNSLRDDYLAAMPAVDNPRVKLFEKYKETKSQVFLILASRFELGSALRSGKGSAFKRAEKCISEAFGRLAVAGESPDVDLFACRVNLDFEWKLRRFSGSICWEQFVEDLNQIRSHRRFREDPFWGFLLGVAAFHLGDFSLSQQCFAHLRSRNFERRFTAKKRVFYQGESGKPKTFEGQASAGADDVVYLYSSELGSDVRAERGKFKTAREEIKFFEIVFSIMGPLAVPVDSSRDTR